MKRAVIYARYSCSSQNEQSIEGQVHRCERYALDNDLQVIHKYIDRATTGTNDKRPAFQQMLKDSQKKGFDVVIVFAIDRFTRNIYDYNFDKKILLDNGVILLSATEPLGTNIDGSDNLAGIILEGTLSSYAYYYSRELSAKIKRGREENIRKGLFLGGNILYGYYVENKKVYINEDEADIVRKVFKMYEQGYKATDIAIHLTNLGIINHNGQPFKKTTILAILKNKKYIGITELNGIELTTMYPPIVDKELFDTVAFRRSHFTHSPRRLTADDHYLLSGKLFCGYCYSPMNGESGTARNGDVYRYYKCFGKKKHTTDCDKQNIRKDYLEGLVIDATLRVMLTPAVVNKIVENVLSEQEQDIRNSTLAVLEEQLKRNETETNNVVKAIRQGLFSNRITEELNTLENEHDKLLGNITELKRTIHKFTEDDIKNWLGSFANLKYDNEQAKMLLIDSFISRILLYDDKVVISYRLTDDCTDIPLEELADIVSDNVQFGPPNITRSKQIVYAYLVMKID